MENEIKQTPVKENNNKLVLAVCVAAILIFLILLFVAKHFNAKMSNFSFVMWLLFIILFPACVFIGFYLFNRGNTIDTKEEDKSMIIPRPITIPECRNIVKKMLIDPIRADYIVDFANEEVHPIGENPVSYVYCMTGEGMFKNKEGKFPVYTIIINMHMPFVIRSLLINATPAEVRTKLNSSGCAPAKPANVKKIQEEDLFTGRKKTTEEVIHQPKEEKKEEVKPELK